ncbi:hypothetical protein E4T56_gene18228 [Termitomyces sp. T112]|nr:hypothetical protein E4T56_gene18228 [Termitomyces sp. T112]
MKKPLTPRPPNSRKYQKYIRSLYDPEPQISAPDPKELVRTDHPASYPLGHRHSRAHQSTTRTCPPTDTILRDTIPTWTNYATRTNLTSPNPANEEGPATFATSAGIRARSREDLRSPRQPHYQENQSPRPAGHHERFEGPPSNTNTAHVPATDKENPYTPGRKL